MPNATNTQQLVTLPNDVAAAIEELRNTYSDSEIIATIVTDRGCTAYGTKMPVLIKYHRYEEGNINKLMSALVNGYRVEKTQEELIREAYEEVRSWQRMHTCAGDYTQADARVDGFIMALNVAGIKIEGVNA